MWAMTLHCMVNLPPYYFVALMCSSMIFVTRNKVSNKLQLQSIVVTLVTGRYKHITDKEVNKNTKQYERDFERLTSSKFVKHNRCVGRDTCY